jgi:hypothetical protein
VDGSDDGDGWRKGLGEEVCISQGAGRIGEVTMARVRDESLNYKATCGTPSQDIKTYSASSEKKLIS